MIWKFEGGCRGFTFRKLGHGAEVGVGSAIDGQAIRLRLQLGVWGLGFGVWGLGFGIQDLTCISSVIGKMSCRRAASASWSKALVAREGGEGGWIVMWLR